MTKQKKVLKLSQHIKIGDRVRVAGLVCDVVKVEHFTDNSVDITLHIIGAPTARKDVKLEFRWNVPVVVR